MFQGQQLPHWVVCGSVIAFAGCASNGKWIRDLPEPLMAPSVVSSPAPNAAPRVIAVRWPAVIHGNAKPSVIANYSRHVQEADGYTAPPLSPELMEMVSTFYAGELYWALRRLDPTATVVLEPQLVASDGLALKLNPLVESTLPVDLAVTLLTFTSPNSALPLLVDVMSVSVSTSPERSPGNCGLLAVTNDTQDISGKPACQAGQARQPYTHWIFDGLVRKPAGPPGFHSALPLNTEQTLLIPYFVEGEANLTAAPMSDYRAKSVTPTREQAHTVTLQPLIVNFAGIALSAYRSIRPADSNASASWAPYVAQFDQGLAMKLRDATPLLPAENGNLNLIKRLYSQELQVRAKRDEIVARDMMAGPFGAALRNGRAQSQANYGGRMAAMMFTTVASIAAGGAAIQSASSAAALLAANNSTFDRFNQQMEKDGMAYVQRLAPALTALERGTLDLLDGSVSVSLGDQADLRAALKAIYLKRKAD